MVLFLVLSLYATFALGNDITYRTSFGDVAVGPDGPWNVLSMGVDSPGQNLSMFPSLTETSLFIAADSCSDQTASCPLPLPTMWTNTSQHAFSLYMNSDKWDASTWETSSLEPLQLQGEGQYIHETIQMSNEPRTNIATLTDQAGAVTSDMTVHYPGGGKYTMDVGFFSLYGASQNQTWTSMNGSTITLDRVLPNVYARNLSPSISYGMHLGSATYGVPGSLVIGGYDRSRVLTGPITGNSTTFELVNLSLGVEKGGSSFVNLQNGSATGLITPQDASGGLNVAINPGVPYLYLPKATCDAIAQHLPVTYDSDLGLYLWNTTDSAFEAIVSSPHVLSFQFASSTSTLNTTIHVPFALLNLTLETPLVNTPTQYFPCRPYTPSDGTSYHLGRAFLQSAFLAQNWQTNTTWLAQAPGPNYPAQQTIVLRPTDSSLSAMVKGPSWLDTWSAHLTPLAANANTTATPSPSSTPSPSTSDLSSGAIAGIVIGALAALALVAAAVFLIWRRRVRATKHGGTKQFPLAEQKSPTHPPEEFRQHMLGPHEAQGQEIHEMGDGWVGKQELSAGKPVEVDGRSPLSELPAHGYGR